MLIGWLEWLRLTVLEKVRDLGDYQARQTPLATSPRLCVSAVIAHLTRIEHDWLVHAFAGGAARPGEDWAIPSRSVEALAQEYAEQCTTSRRIVSEHDLDSVECRAPEGLERVSLRWILGHLIEETARHLGHLDVLREMLDGRRGY